MKEYPIIFSAPMVRAILEGRKTQTRRLPTSMWANAKMLYVDRGQPLRLWVRETWALIDPEPCVAYRADCPGQSDSWRPSIHMPRWASRLTLDVVHMRRERLQDISADDAIAEGIDPVPHKCGCERCAQTAEWCPASASSIIEDFGHLWESLHRKPGTRLADNPEVYVIEFWKV